jgi:predicted transcriptional regulator
MAKPEPSIFDEPDDEHEARRDAEAMADIAAGRVIPNDEVCAWLETWGTPDETPAPKKWFK